MISPPWLKIANWQRNKQEQSYTPVPKTESELFLDPRPEKSREGLSESQKWMLVSVFTAAAVSGVILASLYVIYKAAPPALPAWFSIYPSCKSSRPNHVGPQLT